MSARRVLHSLGHGAVPSTRVPGVPFAALGDRIAGDPAGFIATEVPPQAILPGPTWWSIIEAQESPAGSSEPLFGLATLTARFGCGALSQAPQLQLGRPLSVAQREIESLRAIRRKVEEHAAAPQTKPLSLAVFGTPAAGKSIAETVLSRRRCAIGDGWRVTGGPASRAGLSPRFALIRESASGGWAVRLSG